MTNQDFAAFFLRTALGAMFLAHGLLKMFVFTIDGSGAFFASVGLPAWLATPVTLAEIAGGLLLIVGVAVRPVAGALVPVLLGATWVHLGNGWLFTNTGGGWEYPAFLAVSAVAVALLGPGAVALRRPARVIGDRAGA